MRKNNKNKLFSYSGNKEQLVDYINYKLNNNLILYTDFENSVSDNLVNFGFKKIKLRTMISKIGRAHV